jgi:cation transport ATPase
MTKIKPPNERAPVAGGTEPAQGPKVTKKPMARAIRIALFQREIRVRLSPAALDLLFARVEVISEGQRAVRGGRDCYFGSTMLTVDLPSLAPLLSDACDAGTARRLAALLESDPDVARRIQTLAESETARVAGAVPRQVGTHIAIRSQGAKVFVDVDVEAVFV